MSVEHTLTFLCKSSRGLESQKPVLAIVTAGDRVPVSGRCSYLITNVGGGLEQRRAAMLPRTAADKAWWATPHADWGGDTGVKVDRLRLGLPVDV